MEGAHRWVGVTAGCWPESLQGLAKQLPLVKEEMGRVEALKPTV